MTNAIRISAVLMLLGFGISNVSAESQGSVSTVDNATVYPSTMDGQWKAISLPQNALARVLRMPSYGVSEFWNYGTSALTLSVSLSVWCTITNPNNTININFVSSGTFTLQPGEKQSQNCLLSIVFGSVSEASVSVGADFASTAGTSVLPTGSLSVKNVTLFDTTNDGVPVVASGDGVTVIADMGGTTGTVSVQNRSAYDIEIGYVYAVPKSAAVSTIECSGPPNKVPRTRGAVLANPFKVGDVLAPGQTKVVTGTCPTGYVTRRTSAAVAWEYSYLLPRQ